MASLGGTRRTEQFDQIDGNSKIFQDNPFEPRVDWFESVPVSMEEKKCGDDGGRTRLRIWMPWRLGPGH